MQEIVLPVAGRRRIEAMAKIPKIELSSSLPSGLKVINKKAKIIRADNSCFFESP